jgi:hypothetical protein
MLIRPFCEKIAPKEIFKVVDEPDLRHCTQLQLLFTYSRFKDPNSIPELEKQFLKLYYLQSLPTLHCIAPIRMPTMTRIHEAKPSAIRQPYPPMTNSQVPLLQASLLVVYTDEYVCTSCTNTVRSLDTTTAIRTLRDTHIGTRHMPLAKPGNLSLQKACVLLHVSAPPTICHSPVLQPNTSRPEHYHQTPLTTFGMFLLSESRRFVPQLKAWESHSLPGTELQCRWQHYAT